MQYKHKQPTIYKKSLLCLLLFVLANNAIVYSQDSLRNICEFLGGRSDKNFLGSGNTALVIEPGKTRVLFVQQWKDKGIMDWASGTVRQWYPDRIEMKEATPVVGATLSVAPVSRRVFITRDDVAGMELVWENNTTQIMTVKATFTGTLPGTVQSDPNNGAGFCHTVAPYSNKIAQSVHYALEASIQPELVGMQGNDYTISYVITMLPRERKSLTLLLGSGTEWQAVRNALYRWRGLTDIPEAVRRDWNAWFDSEIPRFNCSNPYFEKLYYYRWWSLYTKMIFAKVGHFYYPAPREGTVAYDGVVSYSGSCISVDELRWMRTPDWAFSTTKEFFAPENLNDGYLSNHIWDWGIDADESNIDALGRSVPYQNYAVAAFYGALMVHPQQARQTVESIWPQLCSNLGSYGRLFDIDRDGLYETYPWSNSAGQEWTARYSYFDPIPEMFRNERGRTYAPDGSRAAEDMQLLAKIRSAVVTDPDIHWPETSAELYRIYYATADHRLATVDQTTYAYKNFCAAASLARMVNDSISEKRYSRMGEQTRRQLLSAMWNTDDAFFYDVKPIVHKQARVRATTGFYPFWARIAETTHLPMLQHLFDPAAFWTAFPLPSLPLDYEKYNALQQTGWNYWNYATWPRTTCHVVDGTFWAAKTLDTTLRKNAAVLFERYTRMHFPNGDVLSPNIAERYDPHTGSPFMPELDYNHSSWIDLLVQHVAGITPEDSDVLTIDPVDMGWEYFSLTNIRYRNHDVDVAFSRRKGMTVRVDGVVKAKSATLQKVRVDLENKKPRK